MTGDTPDAQRPLLLVGIPRGGTSWTLQVLAANPDIFSLFEPDKEGGIHSPPAIWAKRNLGRFPALKPEDHADAYRRLWRWIFVGAPQGPRLRFAHDVQRAAWRGDGGNHYLEGHPSWFTLFAGTLAARPPLGRSIVPERRRMLVKSVHAPLAVEWLHHQFDIEILVLLRHPGNVLASWLSMNLDEHYVRLEDDPAVRRIAERWGTPLPGQDPLERTIWMIGFLTSALEEAAERHPQWVVRTHEQLCEEPIREFQKLSEELGLRWSKESEDFLGANDRPGEGFNTQRVAADLPDSWKTRLTRDQADRMGDVLEDFPLKHWSADDLRAD